jgi:hypothetical protein
VSKIFQKTPEKFDEFLPKAKTTFHYVKIKANAWTGILQTFIGFGK